MILKWLEKIGRKRIVYDRIDDQAYLERYYVFLKDRGDKFPFNIFLHKFLKSDGDDLHDHPWPYFTIILKGGYYEWTPIFDENGMKFTEVCAWRGPGHFRYCSAESYHRIELEPGVTCWTLFMPGRKIRDWGFLKNNKWIQWEEYMNQRKSK